MYFYDVIYDAMMPRMKCKLMYLSNLYFNKSIV